MTAKKLENVKMGQTWTSYVAAAEGALRCAGLWEGETWKLMGMTGIGFHFIIHKQVCASGATVYDWISEHLGAMDRIGVYSQVYSFMDIRMNTFGKIREDAIAAIKDSVQKGRPVLIWAPTGILEFGLIIGYDDEDDVFFVMDCTGRECDPMLYSNLGLSDVPMLFYQIFRDKVAVNPEKTYVDSLRFGLSEWEKEYHISPDYASGRKAYEFLIAAMKSGDIDDFGLAYSLAVYADSTRCIAKYLRFVGERSEKLKVVGDAAPLFEQAAEKLGQLTALFPFSGCNGTGCTIDRSRLPQGVILAEECLALKVQAFDIIRSALKGLGD